MEGCGSRAWLSSAAGRRDEAPGTSLAAWERRPACKSLLRDP